MKNVRIVTFIATIFILIAAFFLAYSCTIPAEDNDSSNNNKKITSITVLTPAPASVFSESDTVNITWNTDGSSSEKVDIKVLYSTDNLNWTTKNIALNTGNSKSYNWEIPQTFCFDNSLTYGLQYYFKIMVNKSSDTVIKSYSDNFSITYINTDVYDLTASNNTSGTATILGSVNYIGTKIVTVKGFIHSVNSDSDYFRVIMSDPVSASTNRGGKNLHFRVKFNKNPNDAYGIKIWQGLIGSVSGIPGDVDNTDVLGSQVYKQFDWGLRSDDTSNDSETFETVYIIEIVKHDTISLNDLTYEVEISNGNYTSFAIE